MNKGENRNLLIVIPHDNSKHQNHKSYKKWHTIINKFNDDSKNDKLSYFKYSIFNHKSGNYFGMQIIIKLEWFKKYIFIWYSSCNIIVGKQLTIINQYFLLIKTLDILEWTKINFI